MSFITLQAESIQALGYLRCFLISHSSVALQVAHSAKDPNRSFEQASDAGEKVVGQPACCFPRLCVEFLRSFSTPQNSPGCEWELEEDEKVP